MSETSLKIDETFPDNVKLQNFAKPFLTNTKVTKGGGGGGSNIHQEQSRGLRKRRFKNLQ